jgi:hypothetical protein
MGLALRSAFRIAWGVRPFSKIYRRVSVNLTLSDRKDRVNNDH